MFQHINWKFAGTLVLVSFLGYLAVDAMNGGYDKEKLKALGWTEKA